MTGHPAPRGSSHDFPAARIDGYVARFVRGRARRPERPSAVVVLVWSRGGWLLADIDGRGWTTPSGHVEPGETALQAARREAREEAGVALRRVRRLGAYHLTDGSGRETVVPAYVALEGRPSARPPETESRAVCVVAPPDLPRRYYTWHRLFAAVFQAGEALANADPLRRREPRRRPAARQETGPHRP